MSSTPPPSNDAVPRPDALEKDPEDVMRAEAGAKDEKEAAFDAIREIENDENGERKEDDPENRQGGGSRDGGKSAGEGEPTFDEEAAKQRYKDIPYDRCRDDHPDGAPLFDEDELRILNTKITPKTSKATKQAKKDLQTKHSRWVARMVERDRDRASRAWRDAREKARQENEQKSFLEFTGREPWEFLNTIFLTGAGVGANLPDRMAGVRPHFLAMQVLVFQEQELAALAKPTKELIDKYPWILEYGIPVEIRLPIVVAACAIPHGFAYMNALEQLKEHEAARAARPTTVKVKEAAAA